MSKDEQPIERKEERITARLNADQRAAVDAFKRKARVKRDSDLLELFVGALIEKPYREVKGFLIPEDEDAEDAEGNRGPQLLAA
jgi:hypothetical protein